MPSTTRPPRKPKVPRAAVPQADVLTLCETAAYLRLTEDEVLRLVREESLPGRLVGAEWRFLKAAIQDWLKIPFFIGSKAAQMAMAGAWKDDPTVDEFLKEVYRQRGRPMTEEGS